MNKWRFSHYYELDVWSDCCGLTVDLWKKISTQSFILTLYIIFVITGVRGHYFFGSIERTLLIFLGKILSFYENHDNVSSLAIIKTGKPLMHICFGDCWIAAFVIQCAAMFAFLLVCLHTMIGDFWLSSSHPQSIAHTTHVPSPKHYPLIWYSKYPHSC